MRPAIQTHGGWVTDLVEQRLLENLFTENYDKKLAITFQRIMKGF